MTQERLQEVIGEKLAEGKGHQVIYNELIELFPGRELDIAGVVAEVASLPQRKGFGLWHKLFMGGSLAAMVLPWVDTFIYNPQLSGILMMLLGGVTVVMGYLLLSVSHWRSTAFKFLGYLCLVFMAVMAAVTIGDANVLDVVLMGVLGFTGFSGVYLERQLGGSYKAAFKGHRETEKGRFAVYEVVFEED